MQMTWLLLLTSWIAQPEAARLAMQQGRYDDAARLYSELARQYPGEPMLRYNIGLALYSARKFAPALKELQAFLKLQPNAPQANFIAAASLLKLNQACPSLLYFDRAASMRDLPEYLEQRAQAEAACGHPALALPLWEQLAARQPLNTRAWLGLGLARTALGQQAQAQEAFARLSALPPSPELRRLERDIARNLWSSSRYADARAALLRVKSMGQPEASLEYELGDCTEKLDGPEPALPFYRQAVRLDPQLISARAALGRALIALNRPQDAIPHLEIAARANIDKSLWAALANSYRAVGRNRDAAAALQRSR